MSPDQWGQDMAEDKLTARAISAILAERHSGQGWAYFKEHRPMTGWNAVMNAIDGLAVGLWQKTFGIFAYEIKVARNDFLVDVRQFKKKHSHALAISHYFYYVCPWGLIEKSEVPEIAGLMYVNKANKIKIVKQATLRELDAIKIIHFQGFARDMGNKIDNTKIPIKFLGREVTQEDFDALVEERVGKEKGFLFDRSVKQAVKDQAGERDGNAKFIQELRITCGIYSMGDDREEKLREILACCKLGYESGLSSHLKYHLGNLKAAVLKFEEIMNAIGKEEE